jgi:hypothetical protein
VLLQLGADAVLITSFPPAGRDFVIQLTAGRVFTLDGPRRVYDPKLQMTRQSEIRGAEADETLLLPFNHPPLLLPALGPLSRMPPRTAYLVWTVISIILFFAGTMLLTWDMCERAPPGVQTMAVRLGILTFFPISVAVAQGQDTALLFLGASVFLLLFRSNRDIAAGLALSLTSIRPQIALGLALPFLFARRRVFLGFLAGLSGLFLYSIAIVGTDGARQLLELVRLTGIESELVIGRSRMPNLLGLLHRTFGADSAVLPASAWTVWLLFIAASCTWWKSLGNRVSILHVGVLTIGAVVLAPHIHLHDAALLAIAATSCTVWRCLAAGSDWEIPALTLASASLILTVMSVSPASVYDVQLVAALILIAAPLGRDIWRERLS